jgi:uncharacterized protein with von Willebrand factor type A (vWA) domain
LRTLPTVGFAGGWLCERMLPAVRAARGLTAVAEDVAEVAARFGAALREAGVPAGADRCERFTRAVLLVRPRTARALRECALATLASSRDQAQTVARVFDVTFGGEAPGQRQPATLIGGGFRPGSNETGGNEIGIDQRPRGADTLARAARAAREHAAKPGNGAQADQTSALSRTNQTSALSRADQGGALSRADRTGALSRADQAGARTPAGQLRRTDRTIAVNLAGQAGTVSLAGEAEAIGSYRLRALASATERLSATDFAELTPGELQQLATVMRRLRLAVPQRRSRRQRRGPRGRQADLRATLRQARQTGAEPFGIIRKDPVRRPRKLVVLCDISGSMEPYARAMLQLLYCAAGGARAEVFSFATRLTRLTRALAEPQPGLALRRAGQVAPDWSGGTRIGASLKEFNDSFGCRGLARGAVVVVVSDGWDTGDPAVLQREMARLSRVAFRIIWVNPRAHRPGYRPLAGGMAAAWPYCDAVVSAGRLDALGELTTALSGPVRRRPGGSRQPAHRP